MVPNYERSERMFADKLRDSRFKSPNYTKFQAIKQKQNNQAWLLRRPIAARLMTIKQRNVISGQMWMNHTHRAQVNASYFIYTKSPGEILFCFVCSQPVLLNYCPIFCGLANIIYCVCYGEMMIIRDFDILNVCAEKRNDLIEATKRYTNYGQSTAIQIALVLYFLYMIWLWWTRKYFNAKFKLGKFNI